ncbi:MAG: RagB/SusD family nutrient uptake outer membrane protein [Tannerella sp.]|jgi:hypothetical protein|nr:RagB/SusD family nutrient uptake outer membrane protein [Tannerella sp.]
MKCINLKSVLPAVALALGVASCINDLDVKPIDPSTTMVFNQNEVFTKIYATMGLTGLEGPSGPAGSGDVDGIDEGTSDFFRLIWNLNELPADEAHCNWTDPGIPELNHANWGASHNQVQGLYYRLYFNITLCNFFLEQTEGRDDSESLLQRAEARFMRALNYYYLVDMFGNVPFVTTVSIGNPAQTKRAELFGFIERELKEVQDVMKEPRTNVYGRADRAAAWLLLARLYLNAEVYTGTAHWSEAAEYAQKVMNSSYELSAVYGHLFMADNGGSAVNKANNEIILPILQDGVTTRNYGGSLFLIASTQKTDDMPPYGTSEQWAGNRCRQELLYRFFPDKNVPATAKEGMIAASGDGRALFFGIGRTVSIGNEAMFVEGVSCVKFTNLRADGVPANDSKFTDTDIPFMRLAEAYLTFAEAKVRLSGGPVAEATEALNALRRRAGAKTETSWTPDAILDEWSREFFFEGRRRSDLIRFNRFGGSVGYAWQWKGGVQNGTDFSSNFNLYPIPNSDIVSNPNLKQNPGY